MRWLLQERIEEVQVEAASEFMEVLEVGSVEAGGHRVLREAEPDQQRRHAIHGGR